MPDSLRRPASATGEICRSRQSRRLARPPSAGAGVGRIRPAENRGTKKMLEANPFGKIASIYKEFIF